MKEGDGTGEKVEMPLKEARLSGFGEHETKGRKALAQNKKVDTRVRRRDFALRRAKRAKHRSRRGRAHRLQFLRGGTRGNSLNVGAN